MSQEKGTPKEVRFVGMDDWNRPVFRAAKSEFYGCTDILFDYGVTEDEVLSKVKESDLTYFGSRFGCEPMGSKAGNIVIVRNSPIKIEETATMKAYTVIMLYPDYIASQFGESYLAHVEAASVEAAVVVGQNEAAQVDELNTIGTPEDFAVLFVCEGHISDLYNHPNGSAHVA